MIVDFLNDRITISLEDFLKYFFRKWKLTVTVALVSAILFALFSYVIGEEISAPPSEEYIYYERNLESINNYFDHSILMQMDPMKIYQRTMFLRNISDKEMLKNYVTTAEIWTELETERNKTYLGELVIWNEFENSDTVEVVLRHATEDECEQWVQYLEQQICEYDPKIEVTFGAADIVTDDYVLERQQKKYKDIDYAETLLEEAQAGYTIEVRTEVAAMVGIIVGAIASTVIILVQFMLKQSMGSAKETKES